MEKHHQKTFAYLILVRNLRRLPIVLYQRRDYSGENEIHALRTMRDTIPPGLPNEKWALFAKGRPTKAAPLSWAAQAARDAAWAA
jgi:hypothetical protein